MISGPQVECRTSSHPWSHSVQKHSLEHDIVFIRQSCKLCLGLVDSKKRQKEVMIWFLLASANENSSENGTYRPLLIKSGTATKTQRFPSTLSDTPCGLTAGSTFWSLRSTSSCRSQSCLPAVGHQQPLPPPSVSATTECLLSNQNAGLELTVPKTQSL